MICTTRRREKACFASDSLVVHRRHSAVPGFIFDDDTSAKCIDKRQRWCMTVESPEQRVLYQYRSPFYFGQMVGRCHSKLRNLEGSPHGSTNGICGLVVGLLELRPSNCGVWSKTKAVSTGVYRCASFNSHPVLPLGFTSTSALYTLSGRPIIANA